MSVDGISPNSSVKLEELSTFKPSKREDGKTFESRDITKVEVEKAVEKVNEFMKPMETSIQFVLHEQLNEYYVKVINKETEEVIKEIPSKKMLDMYAAMAELMGLIINERI